jgi:hypothetical protein
MIKLIDLIKENINPDEQYKTLYSKLTPGQQKNIAIDWKEAGENIIKKLQVINKIKKLK